MLTPADLWALLGYPDGPSGKPDATQTALLTPFGKGSLRHLRFDMARGPVPGMYLCPDAQGPHPAVLYCHAHGNSFTIGAEELIKGRPALQSPFGPDLVKHGIASLSIDLAPFGARQSEGPERALAKAALWDGRTLMGDMLAELSQALDWLRARPEIDAERIATLGLSMGGTHAYWLAALRPEVRACAHLCVFSDIAPLIANGDHDLHGPYMTIPGLLPRGDMSDVAAMIAPRPQFVGLGQLDPLTPGLPDSGAVNHLRRAYSENPQALDILVSPETGHIETPKMRQRVLEFLARHLSA